MANMNQEQVTTRAVAPGSAFVNEIDLFAVARLLLQRIWIILLCFAIGAGVAGLYTVLFLPPTYQSTSTIYIFATDSGGATMSDLQLGSQMTTDLQIIGTSQVVLQQVVDDMGLNLSYKQLKSMVSIQNPAGSHMLRISASSTDPHQAADISNTLAEHMREQIAEVMNTDKPSIVERATVAASPYKPSLSRNTLYGGVIGAGIAVAVIVVLYLMDDTIKSKEDVQKYLELDTLAELPYVKELETPTSGSKKKKLFRMKKGIIPKKSATAAK